MILAIDTSTPRGSIAIGPDPARLKETVIDTRARHSAGLVPTLGELARDGGFALADVREIVVGLGPGSFTGIRIGVAAALGIRAAGGAEIHALSSFDAVARAITRGHDCAGGDRIAVAARARPGMLYWRTYRIGADRRPIPEGECRVLPAAEAPVGGPPESGVITVGSPDPGRLRDLGDLPAADRWIDTPIPPSAIDLAAMADETTRVPPEIAPEPIYLHPPARIPPPIV